MGQQFLSWLTQVLSPYLILMAGFLTVTGRGSRDFTGKTFKVGFEACILGVGIAAVLLGSQENHTAWQLALVAVVFGFVLIVGYGLLNESQVRPTRKARLSIAFSTFVFGATTTIHATMHRPDRIQMAIWLGAISWVLPCLVFCFVVRDNKRPDISATPPAAT
jgi:putative copper export protein